MIPSVHLAYFNLCPHHLFFSSSFPLFLAPLFLLPFMALVMELEEPVWCLASWQVQDAVWPPALLPSQVVPEAQHQT